MQDYWSTKETERKKKSKTFLFSITLFFTRDCWILVSLCPWKTNIFLVKQFLVVDFFFFKERKWNQYLWLLFKNIVALRQATFITIQWTCVMQEIVMAMFCNSSSELDYLQEKKQTLFNKMNWNFFHRNKQFHSISLSSPFSGIMPQGYNQQKEERKYKRMLKCNFNSIVLQSQL